MFFFAADRDNASSSASLADAIRERDQATDDLRSTERAFSDLHRRYEKMKDTLESLKKVSQGRGHLLRHVPDHAAITRCWVLAKADWKLSVLIVSPPRRAEVEREQVGARRRSEQRRSEGGLK